MGSRKENYSKIQLRFMFTRSKRDLKRIRDYLINESDFSKHNPEWFISISYLYSYTRDEIIKFHKRINDVINDTFDPYDLNIICKGYFIEKGKKKVKTKISITAITQTKYVQNELIEGQLGSHLILSLPPSIPIDSPNKNLRKVWLKMFPEFDGKPLKKLLSNKNNQQIIAETLEYVIRDRCPSFIANGNQSIDIQLIDESIPFLNTGEKGWKGVLHYCTKQMYCKDQFLNVFDTQNSNISVA